VSRMPRLIPDVLAVLTEMRALRRGRLQGRPIAELRSEATAIVADGTDRGLTTVHDALARRLNLTAPEFDAIVDEWFQGRPDRLKGVLETHAASEPDRQSISSFFGESQVTTEPGRRSDTPESSAGGFAATKRPRRQRKPRQISVILEEDVAAVFTNDKAVNDALRDLIKIGHKVSKRINRRM
jgi:hypothetical protein